MRSSVATAPMDNTLTVMLDGRRAGAVSRSSGRLRFVYDDDYRRGGNPTPLSLAMPPAEGVHGDPVLTSWLWGLLPDNDRVIERWASMYRVTASSPFALLGTPVGEDCAGAVRFLTSDESARSGDVEWLTEDDVATRLRELRADTTAWLGRDPAGRFSLAGAQAKTALFLSQGRWGLPSGVAATSHILKPAIAGLDDHDLNEHLCLAAAARAGLVAARTAVRRFGDETAIVIERYDRVEIDGQLVRVHQEDMCQALGLHPARKYQSDGGPSAADIAGLLRRSMPSPRAEKAVGHLADALIWNWLVVGTDGHAKNYSLLLSGRQVRLAPLYDIASALPYGDNPLGLKFAMKLGGDYRVTTYRNPWPAVARELGLDEERTVDRARDLAARVPSAFAEAAADPDVAALGSPLPERMVELLDARARYCHGVLARG